MDAHLAEQVSGHVYSVVSAGSAFLSESSRINGDRLDDALKGLTNLCRDVSPPAYLQPEDKNVLSLLNVARALLQHHATGIVLRSRVFILLYRVAYANPSIRNLAAVQFDLCSCMYDSIKLGLEQRLGPQNLIDVLRLMQLLTYNTKFPVGKWTYGLLDFTKEEINREHEVEWMPYCIAILCNLIARSKTIANHFVATFHEQSVQRFLKLLAHDSRLVVICAISVMGRLGTTLSNKFFTPDNMHQTLLCAFNILAQADLLLTVQYAADFLRAVLIVERAGAEPELSELCRNFTTYRFFKTAIENASNMIVTLDARTEELAKVVGLLNSLAQIRSIRSPVCQAILNTQPHERIGQTPFKGLVRVSALGMDKQPQHDVTVMSLQLLQLLVKEILDDSGSLQTYENPAVLVAVVEMNARTVIDLNSTHADQQCKIVSESLILAQSQLYLVLLDIIYLVLANDNEACDMLSDALDAPLCTKINEFQLVANAAVIKSCTERLPMAKESSATQVHGLTIPIEMIKLLNVLKDHSRIHKELYWRALEDERVLPFIAHGLARGSHDQVATVLDVVLQCAQNQGFPWRRLAELIANCSSRQGNASSASTPSMVASASNDSATNIDQVILAQELESNRRDAASREHILKDELERERRRLQEQIELVKEKEEQLEALNDRNKRSEEKLGKVLKELDQLRLVQKQVASLISSNSAFHNLSLDSEDSFHAQNGK